MGDNEKKEVKQKPLEPGLDAILVFKTDSDDKSDDSNGDEGK